MNCKVISAFCAIVLSIMLIFTFFVSSVSAVDYYSGLSVSYSETNGNNVCTMNGLASEIPFANTRFVSALGADSSEENRFFIICMAVAVTFGSISIISKIMNLFTKLDRHTKYLVRLLI